MWTALATRGGGSTVVTICSSVHNVYSERSLRVGVGEQVIMVGGGGGGAGNNGCHEFYPV